MSGDMARIDLYSALDVSARYLKIGSVGASEPGYLLRSRTARLDFLPCGFLDVGQSVVCEMSHLIEVLAFFAKVCGGGFVRIRCIVEVILFASI